MSYKINLLPSEHTFTAEPKESILEAALRSGVNLNYSCNSGGCGECKARIITGEYEEIHHHDYVLKESEKLQQQLLLCSIAATSDMVIEAAEALGVQDIHQQHINAKVARIERIGSDYVVLHIRTPRTKSLRFLAGQSVRLVNSAGSEKTLFIASCPCNGMILQFHLHRQHSDVFTDYVFNSLQVGEALEIIGPDGAFTLDETSQRSVVLVAESTGFAPIKSLIEHAIALDRPQSMQLYWVAVENGGHYQSNYCRAWEDAFDMFVYTPLFMPAIGDKVHAMESLTSNIIARSPIESEMDLYLSCSSELSSTLEYAFRERGTPASRIFIA